MIKAESSTKQHKTIYYKKVILGGVKGSKTLQDILSEIFDKSSDYSCVEKRTEKISEDGKIKQAINSFSNKEKMFYGQLIIYEEGRSQELMKISSNAESYEISAVSAKEISGDFDISQEFIESFLYFCVIDNDLALIQSRSLKSRDLEKHLHWLIFEHASILKDGSLILSDKPNDDVVKRIERSPAKKINIGAPVESSGEVKFSTEEEKTTTRFVPTGMAAKVLDVLMGGGWLDQQSFDASLDDANLRLKLEIGFSRRTSVEGQQILDSMSTSLRHMDSEDVTITLGNGSTIQGHDIRLSGKVTATLNNGVIDDFELESEMYKWMEQRVSGYKF